VPILLYLPDIEPGLAVRFMTPFATRVAVSFPEAERYFPPKKVLLSGYPVRPQFLGRDKAGARQRLGLAEGKVLLVLGGSRGAHRLNAAIVSAIGPLLDITQVVHIGGRDDEAWLNRERNKLPEVQRGRYRVYGYVHEEIGDLLAAADLVLARAGASTLGEFPAAGLPSLLVPYPYAGAHQARNADYLASRGAARVLAEDELDVMLLPTLQSLLGDEAALAAMAEGSRKLARPDAADRLADELRRMARGGRR
jgi:UDP-N-acetylglucosamine--N-acetylmuramyl-(pentapeptide) pyrophosphoryl-undecaprenol N-acetylglucosamine transferase